MLFEYLQVNVGQIPLLYEWILFLAALLGAGAGGYIDLKTTEIPDKIPLAMAIVGFIVHGYLAFSLGSINYLLWPIAVAVCYLVFGYILYYFGQWGEADVLLLAGVGFLVPYSFSFFAMHPGQYFYPVIYLLTTFLVGGVYSMIYAVVVSLRTKGFFHEYGSDVRAHTKNLARVIGFSVIAVLCLVYFVSLSVPVSLEFALRQVLFFIPFMAFIYFIYRFAYVVDHFCFRRHVAVGCIKEGDVLAEDLKVRGAIFSSKLFVGLDKEQIEKIRKAFPKKKVWIKEGIRYGPTFFLTIVCVWLLGNVLFLLIGIV